MIEYFLFDVYSIDMFTRNKTDASEYQIALEQSVNVGSYALTQPRSVTTHLPTDPRVRVSNRVTGDPVIDKPAPWSDMSALAPSEDTRFTNPASTLRGTGINRWQWLCKDPQTNALEGFDHSVSSRIIVKDNHRPLIPVAFDQTAVLPTNDTVENFEPNQVGQGPSWRSCNEYEKYSKFT